MATMPPVPPKPGKSLFGVYSQPFVKTRKDALDQSNVDKLYRDPAAKISGGIKKNVLTQRKNML